MLIRTLLKIRSYVLPFTLYDFVSVSFLWLCNSSKSFSINVVSPECGSLPSDLAREVFAASMEEKISCSVHRTALSTTKSVHVQVSAQRHATGRKKKKELFFFKKKESHRYIFHFQHDNNKKGGGWGTRRNIYIINKV